MTSFQDAKDSFYLELRNRLVALNADRTITVRGASRPAVLVAENEMEPGSADALRNAFVLHWNAVVADTSEALPLEHARCEIRFATAGSPELVGMDRGRTFAAMRAELGAMLQPQKAVKVSYTAGSAVTGATPVFWTGMVEERTTETAGALQCACAVDVFAWKEAQ